MVYWEGQHKKGASMADKDSKIKENTEEQDKAIGERNEANRRKNEDKNTAAKADPTSRNEGRGVKDYDEKHPNPADVHSDDPLIAGLANGQRQAEGTDAGPVR